eukprot:m.32264 g.32264  ORF g.32264 m.32264 type:complete len:86 (+) comp16610_c0_seq1:200-457(+)
MPASTSHTRRNELADTDLEQVNVTMSTLDSAVFPGRRHRRNAVADIGVLLRADRRQRRNAVPNVAVLLTEINFFAQTEQDELDRG